MIKTINYHLLAMEEGKTEQYEIRLCESVFRGDGYNTVIPPCELWSGDRGHLSHSASLDLAHISGWAPLWIELKSLPIYVSQLCVVD